MHLGKSGLGGAMTALKRSAFTIFGSASTTRA
jgi:hypothetical protein